VQWDAQQASIAAAGGDMAAVTAGLEATYGGAADAAMRQAQANAAADDPAARMQKLTQMRDSGLITPDEFEAKKKEILGGI
jgi:membrane protease subunit (stomatin/prohibitin family)